jgi:hypothetical protein
MSENANMLCHDMQPNALRIWHNFITAKSGCYTAAEPRGQDPTLLSSHQCGSTSAPCVQPFAKEDVPVKTIQIGAEAAQTTHLSSDLESK